MFRRGPKHRLKQAKKKAILLRLTVRQLQGAPSLQVRSREIARHRLESQEFLVTEIVGMIRRSEARVSKLGRVTPKACRQILSYYRELSFVHRRLDRELGGALMPSNKTRGDLRKLGEQMLELQSALVLLRDPQTKFQRHLRHLMGRCQLTAYALGGMSYTDPTYISRLLIGERQKPSRDAVIRLASAMADYSTVISNEDVDRLLEDAGHVPLRR